MFWHVLVFIKLLANYALPPSPGRAVPILLGSVGDTGILESILKIAMPHQFNWLVSYRDRLPLSIECQYCQFAVGIGDFSLP